MKQKRRERTKINNKMVLHFIVASLCCYCQKVKHTIKKNETNTHTPHTTNVFDLLVSSSSSSFLHTFSHLVSSCLLLSLFYWANANCNVCRSLERNISLNECLIVVLVASGGRTQLLLCLHSQTQPQITIQTIYLDTDNTNSVHYRYAIRSLSVSLSLVQCLHVPSPMQKHFVKCQTCSSSLTVLLSSYPFLPFSPPVRVCMSACMCVVNQQWPSVFVCVCTMYMHKFILTVGSINMAALYEKCYEIIFHLFSRLFFYRCLCLCRYFVLFSSLSLSARSMAFVVIWIMCAAFFSPYTLSTDFDVFSFRFLYF